MGTRRLRSRETSVDYRRPFRPLPVAALNRAGQILERLGIRVDLDADTLIAAARKKTGLYDLGEDNLLRRRLKILIQSINDEAGLHPVGRLMTRQNLIRMLVNRLRIEQACKRHPEILEARIDSPVFIVGLQRTGTTLLHRLLATDPGFRFLASWEAVHPAPFPGSAGNRQDPRRRMAALAQAGLRYLAPDFFAIHPVQADAPEEDCLLFDFAFFSTVPEATQRVSRFSAWLERQDYTPAYRYYEKILKYLQYQRPADRWLLKTPQHLEHLDSLLRVFPDARVIQTHRDPARCLASFCSMLAHARGIFSDRVDPREVGRRWLVKTQRMISRSMEVRDRADDGTFLDVYYPDLVDDPLRQIRRIYAWLGVELAPAKEESMRLFRAENPQHRYGRHNYDLAHFGLQAEKVRQAFSSYRERFQIPREDLVFEIER